MYQVYLALLILGVPLHINAEAILSHNVDMETNIEFVYENAKALLRSTFLENSDNFALIQGSKGSVYMKANFHQAREITVISGKKERVESLPYVGNGYFHEIEEVCELIKHGSRESDEMSHHDSKLLIGTLDKIREIIGLTFPNEL